MEKRPPLYLLAIFPLALLAIFFGNYSFRSHVLAADAILAGQDTDTQTASTTLVAALQQLQDQEQLLTTQVTSMQAQLAAADIKATFTRSLKRGDSGDDVKELQGILQSISTSTATSTTSLYGPLTEKMVQTFQASAGLKETGIFDSATRDALITFLQKQSTTASGSFVPLDLSSLSDPQQEITDLQSQIADLSSQLSDAQTALTNLQIEADGTQAELSNVDSSVAFVLSTPQTTITVPVAISNILVTSIGKTSVIVTWATNNTATGEVDYSTNSSMPVSSTVVATSSSLVTSHSITLSPLVSGTTYYYHIISKDTNSTLANSTNLSFTTHP